MADKQGEDRLDGWKAIARHLGRDERTVRRWEARGLPVRRVPGGPRASVYAMPGELDGWLNANAVRADEPEAEANAAFHGSARVSARAAAVRSGEVALGSPTAAYVSAPLPSLAPLPGSEPSPRGAIGRRWGVPLFGLVALAAAGALAMEWPAHTKPPATALPLPAPAASIDPQARADYLNGYHAWSLRTPASLEQAREDFGAAIAREPGYAPAYAGLANTYLLLREFGSMADTDAYPKAAAAAETALRLDPQLAAAHRASAFALFWWRHDQPAAWAEFDRALALAPADALTLHWYATALSMGDRKTDALRMIARARALDPGSTAILTDEAFILYGTGRHAEARAQLARVVALDPMNADAHLYLGNIARTEGRAEDAAREARRAAELRGLRSAANRPVGGSMLPTRTPR